MVEEERWQSSKQEWLMGAMLLFSRLSSHGGKLEVHRIFLAVLCKGCQNAGGFSDFSSSSPPLQLRPLALFFLLFSLTEGRIN